MTHDITAQSHNHIWLLVMLLSSNGYEFENNTKMPLIKNEMLSAGAQQAAKNFITSSFDQIAIIQLDKNMNNE